MSASPHPPHDPRDDRPDMDEAVSGRRLARALRRAEAEHVGRVHAGLMAPRLPEGER